MSTLEFVAYYYEGTFHIGLLDDTDRVGKPIRSYHDFFGPFASVTDTLDALLRWAADEQAISFWIDLEVFEQAPESILDAHEKLGGPVKRLFHDMMGLIAEEQRRRLGVLMGRELLTLRPGNAELSEIIDAFRREYCEGQNGCH